MSAPTSVTTNHFKKFKSSYHCH